MASFMGIETKERECVKDPEGIELFKGLAWMAAGTIGVSFVATSVPVIWKTIFCVLGLLFWGIAGSIIIKYMVAYKAYKEFTPIWDSKRGMYDKFAKEFNAWYQDDIEPTCCDGDTLYFFKLQKERLKEKGLTMTNQVMPVKGRSVGTATVSRKSVWYTTDMAYEDIHRIIRFDNKKETIYEREVDQVMYEIIVHTPNDAQLPRITMTCPNCGAVSPATELEKGCNYCDTKFRMKDLFPRVVNLFFIKNKSSAATSGLVSRTLFFSMLAVFLVELLFVLRSEDGFLPGMLALCFFAAGFCGGFLGLILVDLRLLVSMFDRDGMKHVSLFKWSSSKRKITNIMKRYDPSFAFDKFEGQIVALIRMVVFAEQPKMLACYRGEEIDARFSDILEMTYTNATCLQKVQMEGNILHMSLRTWWVNYSEKDGKVCKTGDCIDVDLSRNVANIEPPGFSITSVACPNCGGSFDAVRQTICPHCNSEYHMEDASWVIDQIRLKR